MSSALSEINHHSKQKWWKPFTKPFIIDSQQHQHQLQTSNLPTIFGTPLQDSLQIASVAISMMGPDKKPYIYGFIPVIVAKCGLYLKENATQIEGIFRISGSTKRIKQLQSIFSQPPFYGKDLEWSHPTHSNIPHHPILHDLVDQPSSNLKPYFSVHDAANLLRRYLMCLPEPLINQSMYEDLRQVLAKYPGDKARQIRLFKSLISTLNPSTQYLLLYLLDLLAVFANKSDKNLMTANNLAVVFQPALCPANPTTQDKLNRIIYAQQISSNNHYQNQNKYNNNQTNLEIELDQQRQTKPTSIQQESLLEQESIMKHVKQAQAVVEFLILNQNHFVLGLRPQPQPRLPNQINNNRSSLHAVNANLIDSSNNSSKAYDRSNENKTKEEGERKQEGTEPKQVSTPRPTSSQSILQKQQQQQQPLDDPQYILRRRRSSNLRRSHTLPTNNNHNNNLLINSNNPNNHWNGIMNQSIGTPVLSSVNQSPP